ncbi:DUF1642 domain-containing protein [Streptococcus gallolyticus subsp. gallolyticus]|uniref:DUF1642 domain-containing protein n=1 Tax=Streptococcus gallolyticus TaxID=315405 RepID=UPI002283AC02|nr:DUF1642 domain-containing protein [Streptococcus gallolyticus]MCY7152221.1 DUF1642 domain-containing protein [Streptococcus gallolyticus subsp. gallolyticus]
MINKQEVIEKIEACKSPFISEDDTIFNYGLDKALSIIKQLDEPEKPVVPRIVADWYENNKDDFEYNLYRLCIDYYEQQLHEDLQEWFGYDKNKPIEVLVLMNKYGYEVKKEKLYTVFQVATEEYLYTNGVGKLSSVHVSYAFVEEHEEYHFTQQKLEELNYWENPAFEIKEVKK